MKRMASRTVVLLGCALLALGTASACASEDTSLPFQKDAAVPLKKDAGTCTPGFCPQPATGMACCATVSTCGVDLGGGCVPLKKDGGTP
jgi:hypothetical protein